MIIVISGKKGAEQTTIARALAESIFPQYPEVIDHLPEKKPGYLGSLTIFTHQSDREFPQWLLKRRDFTVVNISILKSKHIRDGTSYTFEQLKQDAIFQLDNVRGWLSVNDYKSALIKAKCLVDTLQVIIGAEESEKIEKIMNGI